MTNENDSLSLHDIQNIVDNWINQWEEGYWSPLSNLARLSEEVGELARLINHHFGEKPQKPTEEVNLISEELADILFVVITLANSLDINLTEAFAKVMQKYDIRDSKRWTIEGASTEASKS